MNIDTVDLRLLKARLCGSNLKKLLLSKNLSKWRTAKDCGLTYRTLLNWEQEKVDPSDDNAIVVGRYLGLIKPTEGEKLELRKELEELNKKLQRIENA